MAGSVNKVIIVGRVGKDPTVRTMQSNDKVASFSLATSEVWRDKASGERKEKTEWHNVSCFNQNLVKIIEQYVKKGSLIHIEGQLETRKYTDKNGVEKFSTEVVLRPFKGELTLLDSKGSGDAGESAPARSPAPSTGGAAYDDSDIPF